MTSSLRKLLRPARRPPLAAALLLAIALPAQADSVTDWNALASGPVVAPRFGGPQQQARMMAIASIAVHDALNTIDSRYDTYNTLPAAAAGASADAAIAAASRTALIGMIGALPATTPAEDANRAAAITAINAAYAAAIGPGAPDAAEAAGIAAGEAAADEILSLRYAPAGMTLTPIDGSGTPNLPAYTRPAALGVHQPTPAPEFPAVTVPAFTGWSAVTPFTLDSATRFRAPRGEIFKLSGLRYALEYNFVKSVGDARVRGIQPDSPMSDIARFWAGGGLEWNANTRLIVANRGLDRWQHARLFALLNISISDTHRLAGRSETSAPATPFGFVAVSLSKSAYLRSIAYLVLLTGLVSALLDFGFKNSAALELGGPELLQYFAVFHSAMALLTAVVQISFAHRALERWGLSATLATLPATILISGAVGAALPRLWGQTLLRGASSVLETSLYRSAYEPLYTPLSQRTRRSTKTLIDVAAGRLGEALGSGSLLVLALLEPRTGSRLLWVFVMVGAALCLHLSLKLHGGYVDALTASLRKGSVQLQAAEIADSTTRLTLSQTQADISRADLLAQLAALRPAQSMQMSGSQRPPPISEVPSEPAPPPRVSRMNLPAGEITGQTALIAAGADLLSAERPRVMRALERGPLDPKLAAFAIPLLAQAPLIEPVTAALRGIADQIVGQLVDAMHDPKLSLVARRRIPRILKNSDQLRAAQGLMEVLRAPERELRHRAATALAEMTARKPELAPDPRLVHELVREELRASADEPANLQHLFAILSLVLERDALWLARRALTHGDAMQRGTALEYLHSTLPEPLRTEFVARLESGQIRTGPGLRLSRPPPGV